MEFRHTDKAKTKWTAYCLSGAIQEQSEGFWPIMTSQGRGKRHKASEVAASPTPSHLNNTSKNCTPSCDEIRLRAYEIYLERGSLVGKELDDWLQAEREINGHAEQRCESTDIKDLRTTS